MKSNGNDNVHKFLINMHELNRLMTKRTLLIEMSAKLVNKYLVLHFIRILFEWHQLQIFLTIHNEKQRQFISLFLDFDLIQVLCHKIKTSKEKHSLWVIRVLRRYWKFQREREEREEKSTTSSISYINFHRICSCDTHLAGRVIRFAIFISFFFHFCCWWWL